MNWLKRSKLAQISVETLMMQLVNGQLSARTAFEQITANNIPAHECCESIFATSQAQSSNPIVLRSLNELSMLINCQQVQAQPPPMQNSPEAEKPMSMPSVEIE